MTLAWLQSELAESGRAGRTVDELSIPVSWSRVGYGWRIWFDEQGLQHVLMLPTVTLPVLSEDGAWVRVRMPATCSAVWPWPRQGWAGFTGARLDELGGWSRLQPSGDEAADLLAHELAALTITGHGLTGRTCPLLPRTLARETDTSQGHWL